MKNKSYIGISFIVLIFGIWAMPKIIAKFQKSDLVEIGPVAPFSLLNQNNKTITNQDYLGKVYVVEFFFTTCSTICPKMNQNMLLLQNEFYGNPKFGIASITIDSKNDSPQVLKKHAEQLGVKHYNWHFLTGDKNYIFDLAEKGFRLNAGEDIKMQDGLYHSGEVALIDKEGKIRSRKDSHGNVIMYYDILDPKGVQDLKEDIKKLLEE